MALQFHFHADHPEPGTTRWLHLSFYLGAILLVVAGVYELYRYATYWTAGDDRSHLWQLGLGILYLMVAAAVAFATYRHGGQETPPDRYVTIEGGVMTYALDQLNGRQQIRLADIRSIQRPSVRDLILELSDGQRTVLPIYLIDDEAKQEELEKILAGAAERRN
ncbi:hypothetical protein CLV84_2058 [Neolewinella xylanilytica]|uniref:Uncharacterized protein n=1 Tax=Neolewinella xylanilytica TaxID=1514080 RepID=A0A2S6I1W3_9BACT|nr:hypothetical protein [Neolewinella xylanilytica]PPK85166.1 hypothetical protein CLV84_2058 [Neolewinella xylanilytica]